MKHHSIWIALVVAGATSSISDAAPPLKSGDRFHITGCENGELMVPVVNLWSKPGGAAQGARVVGKLSGEGRATQALKCQGAVVIARDVMRIDNRTFIRVETIIGNQSGWITDSFIGQRFEKSKCATFFGGSSAAVKKCSR